ncbi:hypothetical protein WN48_06421 [Eufriesea mexicana]|uniref:Uncharacterized protein n=1 Tax=Eufriesea mexicana TaxID=516756 RepID=A0A310SLM6_9HYME|nr:hypothetical protein WN48_06421 [Eufriesea mexicana]
MSTIMKFSMLIIYDSRDKIHVVFVKENGVHPVAKLRKGPTATHPSGEKIRPCSRCESNRDRAITRNVCPLTFCIHFVDYRCDRVDEFGSTELYYCVDELEAAVDEPNTVIDEPEVVVDEPDTVDKPEDCLKLRQWCALYERADWLEGDRHHVILLPMTPGNTNGSITMRPTTKPREYSPRLWSVALTLYFLSLLLRKALVFLIVLLDPSSRRTRQCSSANVHQPAASRHSIGGADGVDGGGKSDEGLLQASGGEARRWRSSGSLQRTPPVVASLTFLWGVSSSRVGVEADSSVGCISKGR